ncbi:uncharacterized protein LOC130911320 [Corythoichthys intestinalis]|uniref:uncharacterized protein LOC130911320 n=1 Tax=Corythoichthys intestinalis TaxID=161448 RepID=UPI0025A5F5F4|nr:uncharacterized protein LOC130911320 [Corythoichthys intestinalis]
MENEQWTEVQYGKRRRLARYQTTNEGMARAFPSSNRRDPFTHLNRPVPPFNQNGRRQRPAYADMMRQNRYQQRPNKDKQWTQNVELHKNKTKNTRMDDEEILREPANPNLRTLVRKLHQIIKIVHHLQNVNVKENIPQPKTIKRMVNTLTNMIKPAIPNETTLDLIMGNAYNWGHTTCQILTTHYETVLPELLKELQGLLTTEWKKAFETAVRWAKRNTPRIKQMEIDHAEALITVEWDSRKETETFLLQNDDFPELKKTNQRTQQTNNREKTNATQIENSIERPGVSGTPKQQRQKTKEKMTQEKETNTMRSTQESGTNTEEPQINRVQQNTLRPRGENKMKTIETPKKHKKKTKHMSLQEELDTETEEEREDSEAEIDKFLSMMLEVPGTDVEEDTETDFEEKDEIEEKEGTITEIEEEEQKSETTLNTTNNTPRSLRRSTKVTRHEDSTRKTKEWKFEPREKFLIVGDANLARIPKIYVKDIQIDSFPGGHFRHCKEMMEKVEVPEDLFVEEVILSFGMESRKNKIETTIKNLQSAIRATKRAFPDAFVRVQKVNYSMELPETEKKNLRELNAYINQNVSHILPLEAEKFEVEQNQIQWTTETAKLMIIHWCKTLPITI